MSFYLVDLGEDLVLLDVDRNRQLNFTNNTFVSDEKVLFNSTTPLKVGAISLLQSGSSVHVWTSKKEGFSSQSMIALRRLLLNTFYYKVLTQKSSPGQTGDKTFLKLIFVYNDEKSLKEAEEKIWTSIN